VRKGGFEPPRLTAPPPQDGASASSATSARGKVKKFKHDLQSSRRYKTRAILVTSTAPVLLAGAPMEQASPHPEQPERESPRLELPGLALPVQARSV
jgi:hypothetical protein